MTRDAEKKQSAADYADQKRQSSERELETGDLVLLEKKKESKLSLSYESEPYKVTARYGDQIHIDSPQGVKYKRNLQHLKRFNQASLDPDQGLETPTENPQDEQVPTATPPSEGTEEASQRPSGEAEDTTPRRSGRVTKPPERFKDFVMSNSMDM